jgi:hypothetical protein
VSGYLAAGSLEAPVFLVFGGVGVVGAACHAVALGHRGFAGLVRWCQALLLAALTTALVVVLAVALVLANGGSVKDAGLTGLFVLVVSSVLATAISFVLAYVPARAA